MIGRELGRVMFKEAGFGEDLGRGVDSAVTGLGRGAMGAGRALAAAPGNAYRGAMGAGRAVAAMPGQAMRGVNQFNQAAGRAVVGAGQAAGRAVVGAGQAVGSAVQGAGARIGRGVDAAGEAVNRNVIDPAVRGADYAGQIGSNVYRAAQGQATQAAKMAPGLPSPSNGQPTTSPTYAQTPGRDFFNPRGRAQGQATASDDAVYRKTLQQMQTKPDSAAGYLQNSNRVGAQAAGQAAGRQYASSLGAAPAPQAAPAAQPSPYGRNPMMQSTSMQPGMSQIPADMMARYNANRAAGRTKMSPAEALGYYQANYRGTQRVPGNGIMQSPTAGRQF